MYKDDKIGNIKNRRWRSRNAPDVKKAPFGKKVKKGTMSEDLGIYVLWISRVSKFRVLQNPGFLSLAFCKHMGGVEVST